MKRSRHGILVLLIPICSIASPTVHMNDATQVVLRQSIAPSIP